MAVLSFSATVGTVTVERGEGVSIALPRVEGRQDGITYSVTGLPGGATFSDTSLKPTDASLRAASEVSSPVGEGFQAERLLTRTSFRLDRTTNSFFMPSYLMANNVSDATFGRYYAFASFLDNGVHYNREIFFGATIGGTFINFRRDLADEWEENLVAVLYEHGSGRYDVVRFADAINSQDSYKIAVPDTLGGVHDFIRRFLLSLPSERRLAVSIHFLDGRTRASWERYDDLMLTGTASADAGTYPITLTATREGDTAASLTFDLVLTSPPPPPMLSGTASVTVSEALPVGSDIGAEFRVQNATGGQVEWSLVNHITGQPPLPFAIAPVSAEPSTARLTVAAPLDYETRTSWDFVVLATVAGEDLTLNARVVVTDEDESLVSVAITDSPAPVWTLTEWQQGVRFAGTAEFGARIDWSLVGSGTDLSVSFHTTAFPTWEVITGRNNSVPLFSNGGTITFTVTASLPGTARTPGTTSITIPVDLTPPTAQWSVPSLQVGVPISVSPHNVAADIASFAVVGVLPPGLALDAATGRIDGTPTVANASATLRTITLTDTAGNTAQVTVQFSPVAKGTLRLAGFFYSPQNVRIGGSPPVLTPPTATPPLASIGATLAYSSDNLFVCTVDAVTGAITIVDEGGATITVRAGETLNYLSAVARAVINVLPAELPTYYFHHLAELYGLRYWTGVGPLEFDGQVWQGTGGLITLSGHEITSADQDRRLTISFSAASPDVRRLFLQDPGPVPITLRTIYSVDRGLTWQEVPRPFTGFLSRPQIRDNVFTIEVETWRGTVDRGIPLYWSEEAQKARYPDDRGLEFSRLLAEGIEDQEWPPRQ